MLKIGTPSSTNNIRNKTNLAVDGPDLGTETSTYADDSFTMPDQKTDPGGGVSTKRISLEGMNETTEGATGSPVTTKPVS